MKTTNAKSISVVPAPSAAAIADALAGILIGHDATLIALAAELRDRLTLHQPARPAAIYLLADPDKARAKGAIAYALAQALGYEWSLYDFVDPTLAAARLFHSGPSGSRPGLLPDRLTRVPHSVIVLDRIEQAEPHALKRLVTSWHSGVILDAAEIRIPTDAAIFLLMTTVAKDRLAQIGRDDPPSDQRYLACLKIMSDAGVSPCLLRHVDDAFRLVGMTMHNFARARRHRLEQQVIPHGLCLANNDFDAAALIWAMTSALGVSTIVFQHRRVALDHRLVQYRKAGIRPIRLVMGGDEVGVAPADAAVADNRPFVPDPH